MKKLLLAFMLLFSITTITIHPAYAACTGDTASQKQVLEGAAATGGDCNPTGVTDILSAVVEILGIVIGIAAVIMIMVSGFKYITSGGDSGKVSSAKNTLIYALIGLLIAALTQVLVRFVLHEATTATTAKKSSSLIISRPYSIR